MGFKAKIKRGMAGSRCGRNRWAKTGFLKSNSKKRRRIQAKEQIRKERYE